MIILTKSRRIKAARRNDFRSDWRNNMRVVFMGTPEFAVPCLQRLIDDGYNVVGVFTQPDKPKGRGYQLAPPPVKLLAQKYEIPVFQPAKMRDGKALGILDDLKPELIVVTAYGKILPKEILDFPKFGCVNVHASLLPKYRGAAPIQWSVINGESKTGVTLMQMDVGLDTGDMLYKKETEIRENETAGELHDRLMFLGAETMSEGLRLLFEGKITPEKQNDEDSCYAPMLDKSLCALDFSLEAKRLHDKVRGLCPWPVATGKIHGKTVRIFKTVFSVTDSDADCGTVIGADRCITIKCGGDTALTITELQPEGKRRMAAGQYLAGHPLNVGDKIG